MNNKKLSEIKFNKRQIWQVVFTAMTASALMAVDKNGQKIVGAIEKEVPELVQQELKEVIGELREGIKQQIVEEIEQEQTMLRRGVNEEATLRMGGIEEIDRISRQQQRIILELERNNRRFRMFQEQWIEMFQAGSRPELEELEIGIRAEQRTLLEEREILINVLRGITWDW